ncbi:MAG: dynamin family protein [Saprospiraceae bacterium]
MSIVDKQILGIQLKLVDTSHQLKTLVDQVQNEEIKKLLADVLLQIDEPFLFVIVGEVKAGKSSFINALLSTGKDICKVAASPMTDTIQQIVYGEIESEVIINQYLKKIYQPVDILKEVTIVDTPGTNTIIAHHQEITEKFIPSADLIVFVFEAKNPYRESSWKFFNYIKEGWWKKVIFVLQQKDLVESNDLKVNVQGVRDYAIKKGIAKPNVFAVSAKLEKEKDTINSGFLPLREYIDDEILGGKAPLLKIENNRSTLLNIKNRIERGIDVRQAQYETDIQFRNDIAKTLQKHGGKSGRQVDNLIDSLIIEYDKITKPKLVEIRDGLTFGQMLSKSFKSAFGMNEGPKLWLTNLLAGMENELNLKLKDRLNTGVVDIADSIQEMGNVVDLKIRNSKTILKNDNEFFGQIATRRINILKDLQSSFSKFLNQTDNFYDESIARESGRIGGHIAAASGITAVGVILAAVTNGMLFDITGGVLTALGFVVAGVTLGLRRKKIISGFESEIEKGRNLFEKEISEKLKLYITSIKEKINANFKNFDSHLSKENEDLTHFTSSIKNIDSSLTAIKSEIEAL